jgi:hypothetical protein
LNRKCGCLEIKEQVLFRATLSASAWISHSIFQSLNCERSLLMSEEESAQRFTQNSAVVTNWNTLENVNIRQQNGLSCSEVIISV